MDRAHRNQKGNGLRMNGPGYRGGLSKKGVEGVNTHKIKGILKYMNNAYIQGCPKIDKKLNAINC